MATYKIPQNVEAEDKLLGPFTFKQFIFLMAAALFGWLTWFFFQVAPLLAFATLPVTLVTGFFGVYRREDQPIETYVLAVINFMLKPRKRLWQRSKIAETVRIVAPKVEEAPRFKRDPKEVKGQLRRLSQIIDTRGWSTKNPAIQEPSEKHRIDIEGRIVLPAQEPPEPVEVHPTDDILDIANNPDAQTLGAQSQAASEQAKRQAVAKMQAAIKQPAQKSGGGDSEDKVEDLKYDPYPKIKQHQLDPSTGTASHPGNASASAGILGSASSEELTVSQVAAQAERSQKNKEISAGQEVSLHNESGRPNTNPNSSQSTGS